MSEPSIRALIVAFDDVLVPTHAARATALHEASGAEGLVLDWSWIVEATRHQSLRDVIHAGLPGTAHDPTLGTLVGLRADRIFLPAAEQGAMLNPEIVTLIQSTVDRGARVIMRADAPREVVTRILARTPIMDLLAFLVCTDDAGTPTLATAWQRIDERLTRVGLPSAVREAVEIRPDAQRVATAYVARLLPWNPAPHIPLRPA